MATATTAPPAMMNASAEPSERIAPRRLIAFLIMVFGMFMSILDIQIVSASLTEIQAGLSASSSEVSWVQTSYLIAEVIAIPLSGFLSRARGDYDTADGQYREALSIREELGDRSGVAGSLRFLGNVAYDRGDLDGAERWWRQSLETLEGTSDDSRRMSVLNNLGVIAHHRGDYEAAVALYDETEALGQSGRSTAGIFSVAQSAACAARPYRYALPMLDSSNP